MTRAFAGVAAAACLICGCGQQPGAGNQAGTDPLSSPPGASSGDTAVSAANLETVSLKVPGMH